MMRLTRRAGCIERCLSGSTEASSSNTLRQIVDFVSQLSRPPSNPTIRSDNSTSAFTLELRTHHRAAECVGERSEMKRALVNVGDADKPEAVHCELL